MDRTAFYREVGDFLRARHPDPPPGEVGEDDNLFDHGYVDSLTVVHLILKVQSLMGVEVQLQRLSPGSFHTLKNVYDTFSALSPGSSSP
ncbi:MAG: acyl carrier protein [Planctomycetaceae bacterium]|nr:acyl carrier protein [Planctomycetaceae bacterium]